MQKNLNNNCEFIYICIFSNLYVNKNKIQNQEVFRTGKNKIFLIFRTHGRQDKKTLKKNEVRNV